jgi:serine/threonine-protein kinase
VRVRRLIAGETFAGRYRVEGFVGQGAMGSVYRVVDTTNGEARALKVMSADIATAPDFLERFLLEAKIGETIQSEHVVRVFDSGSDDKTKLPYFAMELLDGMDLHRLLEAGTELDAGLARAIVVQLFQAMRAAHVAKVVHRDLKPENLFIVMNDGAAPTLKVLDFGVAKVVREVTAGGTAPGLGTPLWAAPEQGKEGQVIRPSADVWALGLLTYRLLAGKIFWLAATERTANAFDLAVEMLRKPIPLASERSRQSGARDLGKAFDAWFAQAVDRDPTARFADAGQAWDALEPILSDAAPASAAPSVDPSVPGAARAGGVRPWLVALAVLTVAAGLVALALARG